MGKNRAENASDFMELSDKSQAKSWQQGWTGEWGLLCHCEIPEAWRV
jgi:hypothetical protein